WAPGGRGHLRRAAGGRVLRSRKRKRPDGAHRWGDTRPPRPPWLGAGPSHGRRAAVKPRAAHRAKQWEVRALVGLAPGQHDHLAAPPGDLLLDRVLAVEQRGAAVGLEAGLSAHHDAAEDPGVAVQLEISLDVDEALPREVRVERQV